jgi:peroxiredoxin Q/BCP
MQSRVVGAVRIVAIAVNRIAKFLVFPLTTMAALQVSQSAPEFSAPASLAGTAFTFSLTQALKKGPVVVYSYPSAYTGGCNIQAHTFAVETDKFTAAGASIIGVSLDSITRLNAFSADPDYCAGKIPVASDADRAIAKSYDLHCHARREDCSDDRWLAAR